MWQIVNKNFARACFYFAENLCGFYFRLIWFQLIHSELMNDKSLAKKSQHNINQLKSIFHHHPFHLDSEMPLTFANILHLLNISISVHSTQSLCNKYVLYQTKFNAQSGRETDTNRT